MINQKKSAIANPDGILSLLGRMRVYDYEDEDLIKVETVNITEHLDETYKKKLGCLRNIQIDRNERYLVTIWEHNYILIFQVNHNHDLVTGFTSYDCDPYKEFGPFGSSQHIFVDDFCTYMAILGENRKFITYYTFDWEHKCKLLPKTT